MTHILFRFFIIVVVLAFRDISLEFIQEFVDFWKIDLLYRGHSIEEHEGLWWEKTGYFFKVVGLEVMLRLCVLYNLHKFQEK